MQVTTLHGIPNCDTVKKARQWLNKASIDYVFRDYKKQPPSLSELDQWHNLVGWEQLLNKRSTSWRKLSSQEQANLNQRTAINYMHSNPSLIKRPLLTLHLANNEYTQAWVGFAPDIYSQLFNSQLFNN